MATSFFYCIKKPAKIFLQLFTTRHLLHLIERFLFILQLFLGTFILFIFSLNFCCKYISFISSIINHKFLLLFFANFFKFLPFFSYTFSKNCFLSLLLVKYLFFGIFLKCKPGDSPFTHSHTNTFTHYILEENFFLFVLL